MDDNPDPTLGFSFHRFGYRWHPLLTVTAKGARLGMIFCPGLVLCLGVIVSLESAPLHAQTPDRSLPEQRIENDTGINVLLDLAHDAKFFTMWTLPPALRTHGLRVCGSQETLDRVLQPGTPLRVRLGEGRRRPFGTIPAPAFNVVITTQGSAEAQEYTPDEVRALLNFVRTGGGLVIIPGNRNLTDEAVEQLPLGVLFPQIDARLSAATDSIDGAAVPVLVHGPDWQVLQSGTGGWPVRIRRQFGRGRIVFYSSMRLLQWDRQMSEEEIADRQTRLAGAVKWAATGREPAAGSLRLPQEASGGGPIYPGETKEIGSITVFYAANQKPELLRTVDQDLPEVEGLLYAWLPSTRPDEPLCLILSAGGGGGWAVNAYEPKEIGIISLESEGVISVFAHELAHTMSGPTDDGGDIAGQIPIGNRGEAQAGWFQGKIDVLFGGPGKQPNSLFTFDPLGSALDLAADPAALQEQWGKGRDWTKIWWVWQKLDDRYGTTWYPRWRWVQHTRWRDDPDRRLTWDEMVEDMSIAVGEDLFPFFRAIGTTLEKERFPQAVFEGGTVALPPAPIDIAPAGPERLDPIGDYRQPVTPIDALTAGDVDPRDHPLLHPTLRGGRDLTREAIARDLFDRHLAVYTDARIIETYRLGSFEIESLEVERTAPDGFVFLVSYAVRPVIFSPFWRSGSGLAEGEWIRHKSLRVTVGRFGDRHRFVRWQEIRP